MASGSEFCRSEVERNRTVEPLNKGFANHPVVAGDPTC